MCYNTFFVICTVFGIEEIGGKYAQVKHYIRVIIPEIIACNLICTPFKRETLQPKLLCTHGSNGRFNLILTLHMPCYKCIQKLNLGKKFIRKFRLTYEDCPLKLKATCVVSGQHERDDIDLQQ